MDEMKLHRQRATGQKALRLWDDELLQTILSEMDEDIKNGWRLSKFDEKDRREEIYYFMRALEDFKQRLKSRIATGKLAVRQLEELEGAKK